MEVIEHISPTHSDDDADHDGDSYGGKSVDLNNAVLNNFFYNRLMGMVVAHNGDTKRVEGIKVIVLQKKGLSIHIIDFCFLAYDLFLGGYSNGFLDVLYGPLNGDQVKSRKFRHRVEILSALNVLPNYRTYRQMSPAQMEILATENREKALLSELISLTAEVGVINEVTYNANVLTVKVQNNVDKCTYPYPKDNNYFSFGNITVLDWGKVIPENGFHTSSQIYPIGFKCIRQEYDILLEKVIDCFCEFDSVAEIQRIQKDKGGKIVVEEMTVLVPLFRLTIGWLVNGSETPVVRIYEAKSPQAAWQAAMLERLGVNNAPSETVDSSDKIIPDIGISLSHSDSLNDNSEHNNMAGSPASSTPDIDFESSDEEEMNIRKEIRDLRRVYFRALRAEQSVGNQAAIRPRLQIENTDSFVDENVLRVIEGMDGVVKSCPSYCHLDLREADGGTKRVIKLVKICHNKIKELDKHYSKSSNRQVVGRKRRTAGAKGEGVPRKKRSKAMDDDPELSKLETEKQKIAKAKMREIDKKVKDIREEILKQIKVRKIEAKLRMEIIVDKEEVVISSDSRRTTSSTYIMDTVEVEDNSLLIDRTRRPEPRGKLIGLPGDIYGQILEIWVYLLTYASPLSITQVPTLDKLCQSIRQSDPNYKTFASCIKSDLFRRDDDFLLDDIGILMCETLMGEYIKCWGLDDKDNDTWGIVKSTLNLLTWKEIARNLLVGRVLKDLGVGDADTRDIMKGKPGYSHALEGNDRKLIRLIRKRIMHQYTMRHEISEDKCGFDSGVCIKLPVPSAHNGQIASYRDILHSVVNIPHTFTHLLFTVIDGAIDVLSRNNPNRMTISLIKALQLCITPPIFDLMDGSKCKEFVHQLVASLRLEPSNKLSPLIYRYNMHGAECARSGSLFSRATLFDMWMYNNTLFTCMAAVKQEDLDPAIEMMENEEMDEDDDDRDEMKRSVTSPAPPISVDEVNAQVLQEQELQMVEKLSVAGQRCFIVIRDLMLHHLATPFNVLLDRKANYAYYRLIAQPIALSDVRKHLVNGGYENNLTKFYLDVDLVFENAIAFYMDGHQTTMSAYKLIAVFERMFFETVVTWDSSSCLCSDACILCKCESPQQASSTSIVQCDRCDAYYHRSCLLELNLVNPSLRVEWYCPGCIEQKSSANTHPNNTSKVRHPTLPDATGEVVGIEVVNNALSFIVNFPGLNRMRLTGAEVRQHSLDEAITMPSGYNYDDYDQVCGFIRAYQGYGASKSLLPLYISTHHSKKAIDNKDPFFDKYRYAISTLHNNTNSDDFGPLEWTTLLRSLTQLTVSSQSFVDTTNNFDNEIEDACNMCYEAIFNNQTSISTLVKTPSATIGDTLEVINYDEYGNEIATKRNIARGSNKGDLLGSDSDDDDSDEDSVYKMLVADDQDADIHEGNGSSVDIAGGVNETQLWENSRLARRRGREDALVTYNVIQDAVKEFDFLQSDLSVYAEDPELPSILSNAFTKAAIAKPSDVLDVNIWEDSMTRKLIATESSSALCVYCGCDESFLASPFVYGQTWEEWEEEGDSAFAVIQDRRRKPVEVGAEHKNWLPSDPIDAELEKREFAKQNQLILRRGSVISHEYCADCMNHVRQSALGRVGKAQIRRIIDVLVGLGRAKTSPIGTDNNGDLYWIFSGSSSLYVSSSPRQISTSVPENGDIFLHNYNNIIGDGDINHQDSISDSCVWRVYESIEDISRVINWLSRKSIAEKHLKKVLLLLYPSAVDVINDEKVLASDKEHQASYDQNLKEFTSLVTNVDSHSNFMKEEPIVCNAEDDSNSNVAADDSDAEAEWSDDLLDTDDESPLRSKKRSSVNPVYKVGQDVLVYNSNNWGLYWAGKVLSVSSKDDNTYMYKIRYPKWGARYDNWVDEEEITDPSPQRLSNNYREKKEFLDKISLMPKPLNTLVACQYLRSEDRENRLYNLPSYSYISSDAQLVRLALLIVEAALPRGCLEIADDRWGDIFAEAWRESVINCSDSVGLMQCLIILETCIKPVWLKQKILIQLSNRNHALRNASIGQVALRLWTIDLAIKYDKVTPVDGGVKGKKNK